MKKYFVFLFYFILTLGLIFSVRYLFRLGTEPFPTLDSTASTTATLPPTTLPPSTTATTTVTTTTSPPTTAELFPAYKITATLVQATDQLPKGYTGPVVYGKGGVFYRVVSPDGYAVRVDASGLTLSAPEERALPPVDKAAIEKLANDNAFISKTDYLVVCSLYRLETYVFEASPRGWTLIKRMDCSAGDLSHPTPTGVYQIEAKYPAIGKSGEYTCPYAVGFFGNYLFHSVPLTPDQSTPVDARIGGRISNGCVRLRTADAQWLYQTLPLGTAVVIF